MYFGSAESFLSNVFAGNGLYDLGACEEHVGDALGHDCEVGESGRIYGTAGAGAEDSGNLGDNARCHDVALENFSITCQSVDAFLDTCATRVVKTDYGCAHLHGHIHNLANLQGHCL